MLSKRALLSAVFILLNFSLFAARYSSSSCTQLNATQVVLPGTTGHQVIRVDMVGTTNGSTSTWSLSSIQFSITNSGNYSSAKLYYGTSTSFASSTLIQTIANPTATTTFNSFSTTPSSTGSVAQTLSLFLVFDIKTGIACNSNSIDASVATSGLVISGNGGGTVTPTSNNPTGNATISASVTPTISIAASSTTICTGTSVTFTPTITNGGTAPTYQWRVNSVNTATGSTFTTTSLVNGDVVSCVLTSNHVCASTTTATSNNVTMTATSTPSSSITAGSTVNVCPPTTSTTLTASSNLTGVTYQWQRDGVNLSGSTASTLSTTISGAYTVVIAKSGCSSTSSTTNVNFGKTPVIAASSSVTNFCAPTTTNLTTTNTTNFSSSFSNTTSAPIPDNSTTGATSNITVTGLPTSLTGVTVTATVNITHTNNTDLEVFLLRPNGSLITTGATPFYSNVAGQSIALSTNNGGTGNNYAATFSDAAATAVTTLTGNTTITGNYRPEQLFSTLSGNPNGVWSLRIFDDISGTTGTFTSWTINFTYTDGTTYSWTSNPSGFTSTTKSPTNVAITNTTTFTVVATDQIAGCTSSASATATRDNVKPTVVCQNISVPLNGSGTATITASQINNGSSDNCSIASTTISNNFFTCSNIGTNTVYLVVTDGSGNVDSCAATVTITDVTKPTVLTTNFTLALNSSGNATLTTANINNGSSDNCGISSLSLSKSAFNCSNLGANTVYLIAQDASGNKDSATATVTVIDDIKPTVATSNYTLALNASGNATLTTANINNGSSDNCGISSLTLSKSAFNCSDLGANTVYLIAQDASGNIDSASATVTVIDNIKPSVVTSNFTLALNASGNATLTTGNINNGSSDNCGISSLSLSKSLFTCSDLGSNNVYLIAQDASGNIDSAIAIVTVIDNIKPTIATKNHIAYLNNSGSASIILSDINNGSSDNCTISSLTLSNSIFNCSNIGINTIYLIGIDNSGNIDSASATVTVLDTLAPQALTQNFTLALGSTGTATLLASDINNSSSDNCGISSYSVSKSSFDCSNLGTNNVYLYVTDASGNIDSSLAVVTIVDNTNPIANCKNITVALNNSGTAFIIASQIDNGSTDNCGITSYALSHQSFDHNNLGPNSTYLIVSDASGNKDSCLATVTVIDTIKPVVSCKNLTIQLDNTGNASITAAQLDNGSYDNCNAITLSLSQYNFNHTNLGSNSVYLIAVDGSGNIDSCLSTVTVLDDIPPSVVCKNININLDNTGNASITAAQLDNGTYDNAINVTLSLSQYNFDCSSVGPNQVYLIATDNSGNIDSCLAQVFVSDTIKPTINCKNITVALNSIGTATITASDINNGSSDNCSVSSLSISVSSFDHDNLGANSVYLIATDPSGNKDSCLATVTIIDNTNPVANCNSLNITLGSNGTATITASQVNNGSSDNAFPPSLTLSNYNFDCTNIGLNYVYLIATDIAGNKDSCLATINVINNLSASASITSPILCNGGSAQVLVTAAGGSGNYTGTGTISLAAGTHTITVTDITGCSTQTSITITEPNAISVSGISIDPICHNGNNGSINISVSGGTNSYTYEWSNLATSEDVTSLSAGAYSVTVTDENGCSQTASYNLANPAAYTVTVNTTPNACFGDNNGTAAAVVSGGQLPYSYLWDNDNETTDSIGNLYAGYYNVIVTDGNNCSVIAPFAISQPDPINVQILTTDNTTICYNSSINLEGYVDGSYTSLSWSTNGDGTFTSGTSLLSNYTPGSADLLAGQVTLTLSAVSMSSCPATTTSIVVNIKDKPAKPSDIIGVSKICLGQQSTYSVLVQSDATSYNWSTGNASSIQSGQGTYNVNINFPINVTNSGTYIYVNAENECGISLTRQAWIRHNVGAAQFQEGPSSVCAGAMNVYYRVRKVEGADSIKWTIPPGCTMASNTDTTAYINFDNTYNGGVIKVIAYFACANSVAQLKTSIPITRVPGNITGPIAGLCDTTVTYSIPAVTGASAYLWVPPAGATVVGANNGTSCTIYFSPGFTPGIISAYALNECGIAGAPRTLSVKSTPQTPSVINGPATICAFQQNVTYSTPAITGINSYTWSVPSTATIVSGQGTNSIVVNFGNKNGGINVQANRTCAGSSSTKTLAYTITCREGNFDAGNTVNIMPNPSNGNFSIAITASESSKAVISIIDLTGRLIYTEEKQTNEGVNEFPMQTNLSAGMYMLRIESGTDVQQKPFIVE